MYIGCNALWLMSTVHLKTKTKTKVHGYQIWQSDRSTSQLYFCRPDQTRVVTAEFPVHFYFSWGLTAGSFVPATHNASSNHCEFIVIWQIESTSALSILEKSWTHPPHSPHTTRITRPMRFCKQGRRSAWEYFNMKIAFRIFLSRRRDVRG